MPEMTFGQMRAEAKTQGFEPIPIGTYNFRVESAELKKGTGSQQISTKIVIMDGPLAGRSTLNRLVPIKNDGDVNGMFFRQCKILGVGDDHPIWAQIDAVGLDQGIGLLAPLLIGGMFIGEIEIRPWMGEDRDNVKSMKPYGGVPTAVPAGSHPVGVPTTGVPTAPVPPATAPLVAAPAADAAPPALVPVPDPAPETPVPVTAPAPTAPEVVTQTPIPEPVPALVPQPVPPATEVPVPAVSPEQPPVTQPTPVATPPIPVPVPVAPPTPLENEETEELATAVAVPIPPPPEDAPF